MQHCNAPPPPPDGNATSTYKTLTVPELSGERDDYAFNLDMSTYSSPTFTHPPSTTSPQPLHVLPSTRDDILGLHNRSNYDNLKAFLSTYTFSGTHDYDSDDSRHSSTPKCAVVFGGCGAFKTALVRMVARDMGVEVLELNTQDAR